MVSKTIPGIFEDLDVARTIMILNLLSFKLIEERFLRSNYVHNQPSIVQIYKLLKGSPRHSTPLQIKQTKIYNPVQVHCMYVVMSMEFPQIFKYLGEIGNTIIMMNLNAQKASVTWAVARGMLDEFALSVNIDTNMIYSLTKQEIINQLTTGDIYKDQFMILNVSFLKDMYEFAQNLMAPKT